MGGRNKNKVLLLLVIAQVLLFSSSLALPQYNAQNNFGNDILLIINYNHAWYDSIPFLKKIYSQFFPNIVFYGPKKAVGVELCEHHNGWYSYKVIGDAMQKYPGYRGYLFLHDDCFLNFWNITRFDKEKIWINGIWTANVNDSSTWAGWLWWEMPVGIPAFKNVYRDLGDQDRLVFHKNYGGEAVASFSDIVYIPAKYCKKTIELCSLCAKYNLFLELAIPTICSCLDDKKNWQWIVGIAVWSTEDRNNVLSFYNKATDFVHPFKFGSAPHLKKFIEQQIYEATGKLG